MASARKQAQELIEGAARDHDAAARRHKQAARLLEKRTAARAEETECLVIPELERFAVALAALGEIEFAESGTTGAPVIGMVEDPVLRAINGQAGAALKSAGLGGVAGTFAAGGAYAAAATFGTASTGTAIATLSGAAASNATLAALGGGSLAAGGGGIAAGTALVGGLAVAPIILVGGFVYWHLGQKALEQARSNAAEFNAATAKLDADRGRIDRVTAVVERLAAAAQLLTEELSRRFNRLDAAPSGSRLREFSRAQQSDLARTVAVAETLYVVSTVPAWTATGNPTQKARTAIKAAHSLLNEEC